MPQGGLDALNADPLNVLGYQYDLACNGFELVSGAIRNHQPELYHDRYAIRASTLLEIYLVSAMYM